MGIYYINRLVCYFYGQKVIINISEEEIKMVYNPTHILNLIARELVIH